MHEEGVGEGIEGRVGGEGGGGSGWKEEEEKQLYLR